MEVPILFLRPLLETTFLGPTGGEEPRPKVWGSQKHTRHLVSQSSQNPWGVIKGSHEGSSSGPTVLRNKWAPGLGSASSNRWDWVLPAHGSTDGQTCSLGVNNSGIRTF